jgi:hypothetical protein
MVTDTLVCGMSETFEESDVSYFIWLVPPFALVLTLSAEADELRVVTTALKEEAA